MLNRGHSRDAAMHPGQRIALLLRRVEKAAPAGAGASLFPSAPRERVAGKRRIRPAVLPLRRLDRYGLTPIPKLFSRRALLTSR